MLRLTLDINATAEMLGTEPELFLELVKREQGIVSSRTDVRFTLFSSLLD